MKRLLSITIILVFAAMGAWADTSTLTLDDAPEELVLKVYPKRQVTLDHKGHAKRIGKCVACHHKPDSEKCWDCHEAKGDAETPSYSEVMHVRCRSCHKKSTEGLTGACSECHSNVRSGN
ncbi:MAG: cytochrome c3 family protein [bacterium]|nr:cytochrome c3 family protein [bacterium]